MMHLVKKSCSVAVLAIAMCQVEVSAVALRRNATDEAPGVAQEGDTKKAPSLLGRLKGFFFPESAPTKKVDEEKVDLGTAPKKPAEVTTPANPTAEGSLARPNSVKAQNQKDAEVKLHWAHKAVKAISGVATRTGCTHRMRTLAKFLKQSGCMALGSCLGVLLGPETSSRVTGEPAAKSAGGRTDLSAATDNSSTGKEKAGDASPTTEKAHDESAEEIADAAELELAREPESSFGAEARGGEKESEEASSGLGNSIFSFAGKMIKGAKFVKDVEEVLVAKKRRKEQETKAINEIFGTTPAELFAELPFAADSIECDYKYGDIDIDEGIENVDAIEKKEIEELQSQIELKQKENVGAGPAAERIGTAEGQKQAAPRAELAVEEQPVFDAAADWDI